MNKEEPQLKKQFIITTREVYYVDYCVEANSPEEAKDALYSSAQLKETGQVQDFLDFENGPDEWLIMETT